MDECNTKPLTKDDIYALAKELSQRVKVTEEQAYEVLKVFHVEKAIPLSERLHDLATDNLSVRGLGISEKDAIQMANEYSSSRFKLENIRLTVKPDIGSRLGALMPPV